MEFKELQEICLSITDCHHSTPEYTESGKVVLRNFNIKNGRLIQSDLSYTNEDSFKIRIARAVPEPGDIVITREAPMGEVCIIPEQFECCLGQRMVLLKPNHQKVDSNYLLYSLMSKYVQTQIFKSENTGSIVSNLRIPLLRELKIPIVDFERQKSIGRVLKNLDDKIELNNRINAELEQMAKALYDYWFVQFDFPNEAGKPYKFSGGKMIYDEVLKREIPEGWKGRKLSEIANIVMGQSPTGESYNENGEGLIFFQGSTDFGWRFPVNRMYTTQPTRFAKSGDILLSVRAPIGTINLAMEDCCIGRSVLSRQHLNHFEFAF